MPSEFDILNKVYAPRTKYEFIGDNSYPTYLGRHRNSHATTDMATWIIVKQVFNEAGGLIDSQELKGSWDERADLPWDI